MTSSADKIAGAPISWGVCEVPGWGYQLSPERVLTEMQEVGLAATEFGPDGFLPADPAVMAEFLASRHLVDDAFLARVGPGAVLINCGRGGLIDTDAVWRALTAGRLSGVGLDVFDPEPPERHPLYRHPDVVLTPHLMGLSRRATAATFTAAARGVLDVLSGREPQAVANPTWRSHRTKEYS